VTDTNAHPDPDTFQQLFALLDAGPVDPARIRELIDELAPASGGFVVTFADLSRSDDWTAAGQRFYGALRAITEAAWHAGRDPYADLDVLLDAHPDGEVDHDTRRRRATGELATVPPPLRGRARRRAADAVATLQPQTSARAALNAIDAREVGPYPPEVRLVVAAYAAPSLRTYAVAVLLEPLTGQPARLSDDRTAVTFGGGGRPLTWSAHDPATVSDGDEQQPSGVHPGERDPLTIAETLAGAVEGSDART
jgi:hypothetical protein